MPVVCRLSPPAKYRRIGATRPEHYAYPECWKYPIHDAAHVRSASSYFARHGHRIPQPQRRQVAARIEAARARFGIGPYHQGSVGMTDRQKKARGKMMAANNAKKRGDMAAYKQLHAEACKLDPSLCKGGSSSKPSKPAAKKAGKPAAKAAGKKTGGKRKTYRNNPEGTIAKIDDLREAQENALRNNDPQLALNLADEIKEETEKLKEQTVELREKEAEIKAEVKELKAEVKELEKEAKADPSPEARAEVAEKKAEVKEKEAEAAEVAADKQAATAATKGKRGGKKAAASATRKKSMKSTKAQRTHWMLYRQAVKNGDAAKKAEHKKALEDAGFTVTPQKASKGDIVFKAGGSKKGAAKKAAPKKAAKKAKAAPKKAASKSKAKAAPKKGKKARAKAKEDKKYPKLPKGYRRTGKGTYTKGKKGKTQIRVYKENPMGDVGAMLTIGLGGVTGAILADLAHRFMSTMGREGRADPSAPLNGMDGSLAINKAPDAKSMAAQVGLIVVTGGIGYMLAKKGKRGAALFVGGVAIGAAVKYGLQLWQHFGAPAILGPTAKDATEVSLGDRLYWEFQPDQVKAIDEVLANNDKTIGQKATDSKNKTKGGYLSGHEQPRPALGTGAATPSAFTTAAPASAHLGGLPPPGQVGTPGAVDGCSGGSKAKSCCDSCAHGGPCTGNSNAYTNPALPPPPGSQRPPMNTRPENPSFKLPPKAETPGFNMATPPRGETMTATPAQPQGAYNPFNPAPALDLNFGGRGGRGAASMVGGPRTLGQPAPSSPARRTVGAALGWLA